MISAILVSSAYIAAQILSDILSLRIVLLFGLSMDAGTILYPLTFTLRDMVHKVAGVKAARTLIVTAGVINVIMAGLFWLVSRMTPDPAVGEQLEFVHVLAPVWRIVVASIAAEIVSELVDTEVYRLWVERVTKRFQFTRVLASNALSIPLDSFIFSVGAFGYVLPWAVVWSILLSNVLVKFATTILSIPGIYMVKERPAE